MNIISYWKNSKKIYEDDGLVLIIGWYDHKNEHEGGGKCLGVHWDNYPQSRGVLSPCVIPKKTRDAMLSGLLHQAVVDSDLQKIESLTEAITFFNVT